MMAGMRRSPNTRTGEALGRGFRDFPNTEAVAVQRRYRCCERGWGRAEAALPWCPGEGQPSGSDQRCHGWTGGWGVLGLWFPGWGRGRPCEPTPADSGKKLSTGGGTGQKPAICNLQFPRTYKFKKYYCTGGILLENRYIHRKCSCFFLNHTTWRQNQTPWGWLHI